MSGGGMVERLGRAGSFAMLIAVIAFLLAPLVVVGLVSLSPSTVFDLPSGAWSLRWYQRLVRLDDFWPALGLSCQIAAIATAAALLLGTPAALAVARGSFPGARAFAGFVVSPLMLPGLVIGIAMLQYFRMLGLRDSYTALLLAHVVIALPFVMRTMVASFVLFDFSMLDAARTLGCNWPRTIFRVMVPVLAPGFLTAGLFAFLASFDNYPISIFLTDVRTKSLPIKMLQYIEESPDPTLAAISTLLVVGTIILLVIGDRLVGLRRLAGAA